MMRSFLPSPMNTHQSPLRVVAAVLAIVIAVPLTANAIVSAMGGHYSATLQEEALGNKDASRAQRRALTRLNANCENAPEDTKDLTCKAYLIVQKECLVRQGIRVNTGCPELNDVSRISAVEAALVRGDPVPAVGEEEASSASSVHSSAQVDVSWDDLAPSDRLTLRRLIRLQICSPKLPLAMYMLCTEAVGNESGSVPSGLLNDIAKVQADQESNIGKSLKDRIEMTAPRVK